ncbi:hypothetical protein [Lysobacter sp. Hz 25]|uniref:hypothetical protein n=1 Tax=Lysobacter sp. Hz 25 TaxID=3383698 RepID=UPI0038D401C6
MQSPDETAGAVGEAGQASIEFGDHEAAQVRVDEAFGTAAVAISGDRLRSELRAPGVDEGFLEKGEYGGAVVRACRADPKQGFAH